MNQLRVLLVDDGTGFQAIYADWLREEDALFDVERTVTAALERLRAYRYDIAFIDYHLGADFGTRVIKEAHTPIKGSPRFVAMTGDSRPETIDACIEAGFSQVLLKPFRHSEFKELLREEMLNKALSPKTA